MIKINIEFLFQMCQSPKRFSYVCFIYSALKRPPPYMNEYLLFGTFNNPIETCYPVSEDTVILRWMKGNNLK